MFAKMCTFATENQLFKKEESRPTWACGLKLVELIDPHLKFLSRPTWACGLKHHRSSLTAPALVRHAPRGRVD